MRFYLSAAVLTITTAPPPSQNPYDYGMTRLTGHSTGFITGEFKLQLRPSIESLVPWLKHSLSNQVPSHYADG